jgi:VWFA-related protein
LGDLRNSFHAAAIGFALCSVSACSLSAQNSSADGRAQRLTIYSRTVVEEVVVTDRAGRAVPGLQKEDFQIFENGKRQAITFFERNGNLGKATSEPSIPPANTFTNIPGEGTHSVTNVLLLDAVDSWPEDEMYAHVQMVKFLASLPAHLRIGIFTLTPEKLNLIWPLNQDSSALREAVRKFSSNRSAGTKTQQQALLTALTTTQKTAQQVHDSQLAESAIALQNFLKHGAGVVQQHNHGASAALHALTLYLAGIPGRKNLFWIVGNFPQCGLTVSLSTCDETIAALADAGISLYPIDAHGVDPDMGLGPDPSFHQAANRFNNSEFWAEATGGRAYHVNDIDRGIAAAVDHGSHYYTLAYVPGDRKEQGRERTVEVKLRGDYSIYYRRHYLERTQKDLKAASTAPASDPLLPLMGHGLPDSDGIPYRLKVVPVPSQPGTHAGQSTELTGKLARYDVEFRLQNDGFSMTPDAEGTRRKSLQVALMVYGEDFKPLNWEIREIHLSTKPEQWAAQLKDGIAFHMEIDAPLGDVYLRTGVYDRDASKVGTLEIPLNAVVRVQESQISK